MTTENLKRLLHIVHTVQSKPYISFEELLQSFEKTSKNTLQRDIRAIRDLNISLEYSKSRNGYYIENDNNYNLSTLWQVMDAFELFTVMNNVKGLSDFVFPEKRRPSSLNHLQPLIDAIKKSQYVQFHYHKHSNRNKGFLITDPQHSNHIFESLSGEEESLRSVAPYILKEFRGLWYLIGKDKKDEKIKTFGFDRISDIKITNRKFTKDASFNIAERYRNCFGIYSPDENSQAEDVVLSFDAENGKYLKANPLHCSQEILKDTSEEFIIKLHIHITLDFLQEMLTRTWSLRVISPDSLRLNICEIYQKALERNLK